MKSDKQVASADGYLGHAIYGDLSEGDKNWIWFLPDLQVNSQRIYRFMCFAGYLVGEEGKHKVILDQMGTLWSLTSYNIIVI